ncbi:aldehyde dehydrogenase family protein [Streptomyces muensis]|uniref:Aldehyde dehydrogenase family protein n=1 Tax=Streptomyces muensis TaxID=1077944 RepID=A0A9X1TH42_STRM4|nr:aldehyde dehydrogenase family protein [Streptomyces muensis]MCF1592331.1 aldehyde dehydrogenase family protein [Streptomyces muensis]
MPGTNAPEPRHPGVYVDGAWRDASSRDAHPVVDPFTEEAWAATPMGTEADVDIAVRSADRALRGAWADFDLRDRIAVVLRIQELIRKRRKDFAEAQTRSMGCLHSYGLGLAGAIELIDMYVETARNLTFAYVRSDAYGTTLITRRPIGVTGGITPWSAPLREVTKAIPALLSGCTVVLKPAPETPFGAAMFAEICTEAGAPPGVVNLVHGGGSTGEAMVRHPQVRNIAFTGSSASGARIAEVAAPRMKRLRLELGGKSAAIVLEDVDIDALMPLLVAGAWQNAGQVRTSTSRVLVPHSIYEDVVEAFAGQAEQQVLGDPMDPSTTIGPLATQRRRDQVLAYIESGKAEGARLVTGGGRPDDLTVGYFVEPTVFADVDNQMTVAREEIFGPVTCFIPYATEDEAVSIANDSAYGLHGAVFGRDEDRALAIARRFDSGTVSVNRSSGTPVSPFGGVKQSGIGRDHGPEGFDSFLEYHSYNIGPALAEKAHREFPAG